VVAPSRAADRSSGPLVQYGPDLGVKRGGAQVEIYETRTSDLDLPYGSVIRQGVNDGCRDLPRALANRFRQPHGNIAREVAVQRIPPCSQERGLWRPS